MPMEAQLRPGRKYVRDENSVDTASERHARVQENPVEIEPNGAAVSHRGLILARARQARSRQLLLRIGPQIGPQPDA